MENCPILVKELFNFLQTGYEFELISDKSSNSGIFFIYQNKFCKVGIIIDYRDNEIYVELIRGKNTQYPSDLEFGRNIKLLKDLVKKYDPNKLQADKNNYQQYSESLNENAKMLKKYGTKFLRGEEWID
ncbi:MAG: hypothetical protein ABJB11_08960 [Ferruginibacter sp.]